MDEQYSVEFFSSLVESLQNLCQMHLSYNMVEVSGYISIEIDTFRKERYVVSEILQSTGNVLSDSHCLKAFNTSDIAEHQPDFSGKQRHRFTEKPYSVVKDNAHHTLRSPPLGLKRKKVNKVSSSSLTSEHDILPGDVGQHTRRHQGREFSYSSSFKDRHNTNESDVPYFHPVSESMSIRHDLYEHDENGFETQLIERQSSTSQNSVDNTSGISHTVKTSPVSPKYQSAPGTASIRKKTQHKESVDIKLAFGEGYPNIPDDSNFSLQNLTVGNCDLPLHNTDCGNDNISHQNTTDGNSHFPLENTTSGNSDFSIHNTVGGNSDFDLQETIGVNSDISVQNTGAGNSDFSIQNTGAGNSDFSMQMTGAGNSDFSMQEHLDHHPYISVKNEAEDEVICTGFEEADGADDADGASYQQNELEHPGMSTEAEDDTSYISHKTSLRTDEQSSSDCPVGEEDMIVIDEEDDTCASDWGLLDTSLIDLTAQHKLATFKKPVQSALSTFVRFLNLKQVKDPVLSMSQETLDQLLAEFYACARTKTGQQFTANSLRAIKNFIEVFLQHNGYPVSIKGKEFSKSVKMFKQRMTDLRAREKHSIAVKREDVDKMFNLGILGTGTAESLIRTLWLMITVHFTIKGGRKHAMLNWGDFELELGKEGEEYLHYKPLGVIARGNRCNPSRCFIRYFQDYKELRPESTLSDNAPFYLEIANNRFQTTRVSETAMRSTLKGMLLDAGLSTERKVINMNIL